MDFTASTLAGESLMQPLNAADYFTLAMDAEIRRDAMPGNLCAFVLELSQPPHIDQLAGRIEEFGYHFPISGASLTATGKRFYWHRRPCPVPLFFQHYAGQTDFDTFADKTLETILNLRQALETVTPLEFHLIHDDHHARLAIRWLHPVCDARGIALILYYLTLDDPAERARMAISDVEPLIDFQLKRYRWWQKIKFFWKAHRYIHSLDKLTSIQHGLTATQPLRLQFAVQRFTTEQSARIARIAREKLGLTALSRYYIGCLMRALHRLQPEQQGEAYCVPYAFNLRKQKALTPVLGNHIGTLFAQAPKALISDRTALFEYLKQHYQQTVRKQLDYAFLPVMHLAQRLPLARYGRELRNSYRGGLERSSFWFSDIGQQPFEDRFIGGSAINAITLLSHVTTPPGLALLCCYFNQRLMLSYNYNQPIFTEDFIAELQAYMAQELLEDFD
jgi:hypothetical protein